MLDHVTDLAMDRQGDLRPHPLIDADQFVARRMARDVDIGVVVGDHLYAARQERIVQPSHRALVARDDARGEDRGVARFEHQVAVLAVGQLGHRGARLALAAGADEQHLVARQVARLLLGNAFGEVEKVAAFLGCFDHALQRPARQHGMAAGGDRRQRRALDARQVGGKAGDGHPALAARCQFLEVGAHRPPSPPRPRRRRWCCRTPWRTRPRRRCASARLVGDLLSNGRIDLQSPV
jgi:hypothetical protein